MKIIKKAYAKVNLMLRVVGKFDNNYHELQMVNGKIDLFDEVCIVKNNTNEIAVEFIPPIKNLENNIVLKIAQDMARKFKIDSSFKIKIKKNIPLASGLGGASADASAAIDLIDEYFNLKLTKSQKRALGIQYGADIPYMFCNGWAIVEGVGEIIKEIDLKLPIDIIIINPRFEVHTKDVFKEVIKYSHKLEHGQILAAFNQGNYQYIENDLFAIVKERHSQINDILKRLNELTSHPVFMTGSGPTLFMLVNREFNEEILKKQLKKISDIYMSRHHFINNA